MKRYFLWILCVLMAAGSAMGQVRVSKSAGAKSSLTLAGFAPAQTASSQLFRKTLESDLMHSGWLAVVGSGNAEFSLLGSCEDSGGSLTAKCQLYETATRRNPLSKSYQAGIPETRKLAHTVADEIIEALTGRKGLASTRMALSGNATGKKELYICDADGQNLIQLTRDNNISLAPKWGPDGRTIVYTSFLKRYPDVYLIDVVGGSRRRLASFPGLNTGAAISPNGREVALILSKDGNPDLYVMGINGGAPVRITSTPRAGEASPSWSPDGNRIVYVSDQSGTPQLYVVGRDGGSPMRLTSRGNENVAPDWGINGLIAFSTRMGGGYQVCVIDPNTLETRQISPWDASYEDPSWARDGRHIACARVLQYKSAIYLLDTLGDPPIRLLDTKGDWFSPAWSPN